MINHTAHYAFLAALLFAGTTAVFAADTAKSTEKTQKRTVTLQSGKVLEDAYVLDKKPNGVTVGYKDGCIFVRYADMPENIQKRFDYNKEEADKYEKKIEDRKKSNKKAAETQKAKEKKQKAEQNRRNRERQIAQQEQTVRKLELQLEEAQKQLKAMEDTVNRDRGALVSTLGNQVSVDTPFGFRAKSSNRNAAVRNKLMKEVDTTSVKRDNKAQDVIDLQLKLEAAQKTLDRLREDNQ
ncbi:MAG: hypothetical protein J6W70_07380 [Lentisphaeria bacterium]|nr:hypothetical protein [Lentisphaeria bacterium]